MMKNYLIVYIQRIRNNFPTLSRETAHQIAFAFLTFKMGLYEDSILRCTKALNLLKGVPVPSVLVTALSILKGRAEDLAASRVQSVNLPEFNMDERSFIPINIATESVDDPVHLTISNSLILLYAVALATSQEDSQALEEQERYVIQLLTSYKRLIAP